MLRILLIEDNEMNRDMLTRRLIRKGYKVLNAKDGEEGIQAAVKLQPDLILMDIGLPGISGWEASKVLKSRNDTKSIPIIALTAHATENDRQKSFEVGCNDFETKPLRFQKLVEKINSLLN
jgi:two-component system, cell cycle response regulator DivK